MKQKVPGGEEGDLSPGEGGQVPGHAPGLPVVGAHQHQGAAGGLAEPRGHIGPVDGGQPRQSQGALPLCQGLGQGGEVPQPGEKAGETGGSNGHRRNASFVPGKATAEYPHRVGGGGDAIGTLRVGSPVLRTLGVGGSEATLGRSAPGAPPTPAGEPDFL